MIILKQTTTTTKEICTDEVAETRILRAGGHGTGSGRQAWPRGSRTGAGTEMEGIGEGNLAWSVAGDNWTRR